MTDGSRPREAVPEAQPPHSARKRATIGLLRTADVLRRYFDCLFEPCGLAPQQYNVLRILRGARPEPLPTMVIAERMIEQAPGITRLLDRLEEKGLVNRERCAEDRRRVHCSITAEGLRVLEELDEPVDEADETALGMLDDNEVGQLIQFLDRIRAGLS